MMFCFFVRVPFPLFTTWTPAWVLRSSLTTKGEKYMNRVRNVCALKVVGSLPEYVWS